MYRPLKKLFHTKLSILYTLWLSLFMTPAFALPNDNEQTMKIRADSTLFNYKSGSNIYEGHVIIHQGSTRLTADRVITRNGSNHKLEEATAYGLNKLAEYTTTPNIGDPLMHAQAKVIRFYPPRSTVMLENLVKVTQGENSFHGELIIYNMKDQTVTAPATKNGHATIIIEPNKLKA
jgi:lipopolysaccharide export system protein LptA